MKNIFFFYWSFWVVLAVSSCNSVNQEATTITTRTSGEMKILTDDTFKPILQPLTETFQALYPKTNITIGYCSQRAAFDSLLSGVVDLIIAGRPLNESEITKIKKTGLKPKVNEIALDALVFVVHKDNPITVISMDSIRSLLKGQLSMQLVGDKSNSETLRYLQGRFALTTDLKNIKASGSDSLVIEYVAAHPQAVGVVGMAYLADRDDKRVREKIEAVKLLTVSYKDSLGVSRLSYPVQEEIALRKYPFIRTIFVINLDGSENLGTGFANYLVSERGQRIVLKSGLMPYKMPGRELLIK